MTRCLVHLYSPSYLLSALSAVRTLHEEFDVSITIVVQLPGARASLISEITSIVRELVGQLSGVDRVAGLDDHAIDRAVADFSVSHAMRRLLGEERFDEFYYAHDSVGATCRLLAASY